MTRGGKQFLARLFLVLSIGFGLVYVVAANDYSGTASGLFAVAAFIMFRVASRDKTSADPDLESDGNTVPS